PGRDTWPPAPLPETIAASPRRAHRQGPDKVVIGLASALGLLLLAGGGTYFALHDRDKGGDVTPPADAFKAIELSEDTDVNRPVKLGDLSFQIGAPECGEKIWKGVQSVKGELCLVPLTLTYGGATSSPRVERDSQKLIARDGTAYKAAEYSLGILNSAPSLKPGDRVAGNLLFDVPANTEFTHFEIADATKSQRIVL
ncbi:DUF4352 domain-containing protein, partial [Actinocorallia lasiicapitis]